MRRTLLLTAALLMAFAAQAQDTVPLSLARLLADAPSDTSRYHIFRQAHLQALTNGQTLDYSGIDTLHIAIPAGAKPIPLAPRNDFANIVIVVKNTVANLFLFSRTPAMQPIATDLPDSLLCAAIDSGDFSHIPALAQGRWLLQVVDSTPWVNQRIGHSYGHYREELLCLDSGRTADRPTMPYIGTVSTPRLFGRPVADNDNFQFSNITLLRDSLSTYKTYLLNIENLTSPILSNVTVVTPSSDLVDDCIIRIYNCANVTLNNLALLGSYSRTDHSGYGLLMNNCRNTLVQHLFARSAWGIFGTNNMHYTHFFHCDFDRFDILLRARCHLQLVPTARQLQPVLLSLRQHSLWKLHLRQLHPPAHRDLLQLLSPLHPADARLPLAAHPPTPHHDRGRAARHPHFLSP